MQPRIVRGQRHQRGQVAAGGAARDGDEREIAALRSDVAPDPGERPFDGERTLKMFEEAGFTGALSSLPTTERVTWPAAEGFPDATFDHVFVKGIEIKTVRVPQAFGNCSDHRPVVVDLQDAQP